jgi:hypothetical protein
MALMLSTLLIYARFNSYSASAFVWFMLTRHTLLSLAALGALSPEAIFAGALALNRRQVQAT